MLDIHIYIINGFICDTDYLNKCYNKYNNDDNITFNNYINIINSDSNFEILRQTNNDTMGLYNYNNPKTIFYNDIDIKEINTDCFSIDNNKPINPLINKNGTEIFKIDNILVDENIRYEYILDSTKLCYGFLAPETINLKKEGVSVSKYKYEKKLTESLKQYNINISKLYYSSYLMTIYY